MSELHKARLDALRAVLKEVGLDGFIIPRADEHLGEYVPQSAERLAFISGFTGSAGLAVVLGDAAAVFSDGRYSLQLEAETDPACWERLHVTETPPEAWLKARATGLRIGYDPMLVSADFVARFEGVNLQPTQQNPVDLIWATRPAPPMAPAFAHNLAYAGEECSAKRRRLAAQLRAAGHDAALLTDPASLAWLFNIRGADVPFTPVALGFAILNADASAIIFMDGTKIAAALLATMGAGVSVLARGLMAQTLGSYGGKTVRYDSAGMPVWFKTTLQKAGALVAAGPDPVALPRACKNAVEQNGVRAAHLRDGAAMARFLAWASTALPTGAETEISAADRLLALRQSQALFKGESFPAISGAGEHGAVIHYRVQPASNRAIKADELYLIDSGAQYSDGTTDITRTLWTGPNPAPAAVKDHYTRVLAGHVALAALVFPQGVAGAHVDAFARNALWQAGLDYDHGTGHGVGAYLSVHEGPAGISRAARPVALQEGMVLSNEPGFYLPGAYGIRLENLILVRPAEFAATAKQFLRFETLSWAPFDRALIERRALSPAALDWLNAYHADVWRMLSPCLDQPGDEPVLAWLAAATAPL